MSTKTQFKNAYRQELVSRYAWATGEKLERFMASVETTLNGGNTWTRSGEAYEAALVACGLPKRITLKALHAMPD